VRKYGPFFVTTAGTVTQGALPLSAGRSTVHRGL